MMDDPSRRTLVHKALTSNLTNCVRWKNAKTIEIVQGKLPLGLTPGWVRRELIRYAKTAGEDVIRERAEAREWHRDEHDYWYKVMVPVDGIPGGLFVEIVLHDDDAEMPVVLLVSAHP